MSFFVNKIINILNKLKIDKVIIIGHCFGGMVAQEISLKIPDKVDKLILICSGYRLPRWAKTTRAVLPFLRFFSFGPKYQHVDFSKFKGTNDFDIKRLASDINHVGLNSYINIFKGIKDWNSEKELHKIKTPTLVIAGKQDKVFPPDIQKKLSGLIPNAKLKFLNTNHIAPVNQPQALRKLIFEFI